MPPVQPEFFEHVDVVLNATQLIGQSGKVFDNLGARSTVNNLITLQKLFNLYQPRRTLEIGLSFGVSALLFANLHRDAGRPAASQHVALDPFQHSVWDDVGLAHIDGANLGGYVDFRQTYSCYELPRLLEKGELFDLIYVDGSHLFEDVFVDAYYATRLLSMGGLIAFDDCADPHVAKVIHFLQKNVRDGIEEVDLKPFRGNTSLAFAYHLTKRLNRIQMRAFRRKGDIRRKWDATFLQF